MSGPLPPIDKRRRYWPTQQERAEAKHICQCPGTNARFVSAADRLLAKKAKFVGCCCTQEVARLYANMPRVQDGLPCSTHEVG